MRNPFRSFIYSLLTLSIIFSLSYSAHADNSMTSSKRIANADEETLEQKTTEDIYSPQEMNSAEQTQTPENFPAAFISFSVEPLNNELRRYQQAATQSFEPIPPTKLKNHVNNPVVILLRNRLEMTGDLDPMANTHSTVFDKPLAIAVKQFQARHGLTVDGVVGPATLAELNVTPMERIRQIQINYQRLQVLYPQLGDRYILVNIPDYRLHLVENGHEVLTMKAIVGKPDLQTPEVTSRITRVVFNPYWNVPTNIANNDIIPKMNNDPYYLDDMHIKVYLPRGDNLREVNHRDVDWDRAQYSDNMPYLFRQEPGNDNSLGLVKFEFVNPFDVYLHDTPAKTLFDQDNRALSHGCVRLEKPFDLVNYLIKDTANWNDEKIQGVLESHKTTYVRVGKPIPIFITYLTVWVDERGIVNYRSDIYNRDSQQ